MKWDRYVMANDTRKNRWKRDETFLMYFNACFTVIWVNHGEKLRRWKSQGTTHSSVMCPCWPRRVNAFLLEITTGLRDSWIIIIFLLSAWLWLGLCLFQCLLLIRVLHLQFTVHLVGVRRRLTQLSRFELRRSRAFFLLSLQTNN